MNDMRAGATEGPGTAGQSFVKGIFELLGWGVSPNPEHDLGTDHWLMARDSRRVDLRALVGAQVKSGPSWFEEPGVHEESSGWWFREQDDSHFNYWTKHSVPHLLVLFNLESKTAYWVQITADRVISTGKGNKIFVRADSTVDEEHRDQLEAVAMSGAVVPDWEGSAWSPGQMISTTALLRYALATPRLVAPHPNSGPADITAHQAVALLTQLRLSDLSWFARTTPLADAAAAADSDDWTWRFYADLHTWISQGTVESLIRPLETAATSHDRSAAVVCLSHAYFENGRITEALEVLDHEIDHIDDEANPVDLAWLQLHRARCLAEKGQLGEAHVAALASVTVGQTASHDPTARMIAGAAIEMIFQINVAEPARDETPRRELDQVDIGQTSEIAVDRESGREDAVSSAADDRAARSIEDVVRGQDTVAAWWRSQVLATGLGKQLDEDFAAWANDKTTTIGDGDLVWSSLRSAMLLAGLAADTKSWRYTASLLARRQLMTAQVGETPVWTLDLLRFSGSEKSIKLAVDRLLESGPVDPVVAAASTVDLDQSTRTSLRADLTLVERAADVLAELDADRHARWAIRALGNGTDIERRFRPRFLVREAIVSMLAALTVAASSEVGAEIRRLVVSLPPVDDDLTGRRYASLIELLEDSWTDDEIELLKVRSGDVDELASAIVRLAAQKDSEVRARLVERIAAGELTALSNYGNVTDLPRAAAAGMIKSLAGKVRAEVAEARRGAYGFGGHDLLRTLVLLNVWHPEVSDWAPCIEALEEPRSAPAHIAGAIALLGATPLERVPPEVRRQIRSPLETIRDREPDDLGFLSRRIDVRGAAALAVGHLFPSDVTDGFLCQLLLGGSEQRAAAVRIVLATEQPSAAVLLASLAGDPDASVRATVVEGAAHWTAKGVPGASKLLDDLLGQPGIRSDIYASRALRHRSELPNVVALVEKLASSRSAIVRARIGHIARGEH